MRKVSESESSRHLREVGGRDGRAGKGMGLKGARGASELKSIDQSMLYWRDYARGEARPVGRA